MEWLSSFGTTALGFLTALKNFTISQRLFLYAVLSTMFLLGYFIALPRYDCKSGVTEACVYVAQTYKRMID